MAGDIMNTINGLIKWIIDTVEKYKK
ncbi:delta-lysin family phenol-soluble modulin [Staphylococcus massiliensis]|nr:delta-lysin family phenol-soluble modulin [Staphylococcus massiliensis]MCG3399889.1 delta-lysin family phenol-soluble modulin [Staphylococcus massiliensis]MCG3399890.1 delta-lysin family phenol-soluble modulin [Staphylococcus massiliensis]MCG3402584.1 delta-lysin family phenol-soluble modulin [Staphylococcus massiliensis]MCG3413075.1 delta-lysin family phenol-soluble modulin [Staphylococcus massiliensis]